MMNITETLEEKGQGDLITNLFHLACTGACPPLLREWLVDELSEQGHKRWDNTVTSSLTTLQALVHENLIPALDRITVVISRLRGLAMYHDTDWIFSSPATEFTSLLETLKNMRLLAQTVLLHAGDQKRQFAAFSKWLRFIIDFEATEPDSQSRAEMEGRDSGVDISLVLEYVRYGLQQSSLLPYLTPEVLLEDGDKAKDKASYEDTRKAIEVADEGLKWRPDALCLEHVLGHLVKGTTGLLRQVSKWQESGIQMDSGIVLSTSQDTDNIIADMRMIYEVSAHSPPAITHLTSYLQQPPSSQPPTPTQLSTYIALAHPQSHTLHLHHLTHSPRITSLPRDLHSHLTAALSFPAATTILDTKIADDAALLVLLSPAGKEDVHRILRIPYTVSTPSSSPLTYHTLSAQDIAHSLLPNGTAPAARSGKVVQLAPAEVRRYTVHVFEREGRFVPSRLVVNGRKGRRVVVVLARDGRHYRVLDLDCENGRGEDEEGETEISLEGEGEEDGEGDTVMSGV
jgi:anaphase-promoting complex subunit 4